MNNKGFTLVELLAVIVIMSVIGGIATYNVVDAIEHSRQRSEKIFKDKIAISIETYINNLALDSISLLPKNNIEINFEKCYGYSMSKKCKEEEIKPSIARQMAINGTESITLDKVITTSKLFQENELINPATKEQVKNLNQIEVYLFKDSEYVYYYYLDLNQIDSNIKHIDNSSVTNIPKSFCDKDETDVNKINANICKKVK